MTAPPPPNLVRNYKNPVIELAFDGANFAIEYKDMKGLNTLINIFCAYGLTQTKLPIAYAKIHYDVHISRLECS